MSLSNTDIPILGPPKAREELLRAAEIVAAQERYVRLARERLRLNQQRLAEHQGLLREWKERLRRLRSRVEAIDKQDAADLEEQMRGHLALPGRRETDDVPSV